MKIYADTPTLRVRQQVQDAATLLWVVVWLLAGYSLYRNIEDMRGAARGAEAAGAGFADRLDAAASTVRALPLLGEALRQPLVGAADAGRRLQAAGGDAGDTIHSMALWLGLLIALLPIVWLLARYGPGRLRWMREAAAVAKRPIGPDDLHLFALRAVASAPLHELQRATPDPAAAMAKGDYAPLAAIELARLGLRPPTTA